MSELINKLAAKAYCRTEYDNGSVHECYEFSQEELIQFTKSIVKECESVICNLLLKDGKPTDSWESGYVQGMQASLDYIKTHFGV